MSRKHLVPAVLVFASACFILFMALLAMGLEASEGRAWSAFMGVIWLTGPLALAGSGVAALTLKLSNNGPISLV
jgi:hypothetical protein